MSRAPNRSQQSRDSGGPSLNDILNTSDLKLELATLIALCSDSLRRDLLAVFEPITQPQSQPTQKSSDNLLIDFDEPVQAIEGRNQESGRVERLDQSDLQTPQAQGLQRAAVTFFDRWQIGVLRRVGEVLSVRPDAVRKARADAKLQAETLAKTRRERAYHAWANGEEDDGLSSDADGAHYLPEGFPSRLLGLPKHERTVILDSALLLLLSLEHYTSHSRALMLRLGQGLRLPESVLAEHEAKVADGLLESAAAAQDSSQRTTGNTSTNDAANQRWKIGLATVAGAALIGITGGLAAPILAASIGGIMGGLGLGAVATLLGPLATNMVLVGGLFGAYGGRMTGRIVEQYTREIKDFEFLPVSSPATKHSELRSGQSEEAAGLSELRDPERRKAHKLRVLIGISGSVTEVHDYLQPWNVFSTGRIETFGLRWEMDALIRLGRKMSEILSTAAWNFAGYQLASLVVAGLWPFGLLSAAQTLDSPFAIAKTRSQKAGKVLAELLINQIQGARPVTLVGYGLGAGVIHSCLLHLAEQNAFGLVESAVLMGAAAPSDAKSWRRMRAMVSGRLVNVYSTNDLMLGVLYRATSAQLGVAGVSKVVGVPGVENFDLTDTIQGQDRYKFLTGTILQRIGFSDLDTNLLRQQQQQIEALDQANSKTKQRERTNEKTKGQEKEVALAKEDSNGQIVVVSEASSLVQEEKRMDDAKDIDEQLRSLSLAQSSGNGIGIEDSTYDTEDDDESDHHIKLEDNESTLNILDPTPEPEEEDAEQETVRFGHETRGFQVEWRNRD